MTLSRDRYLSLSIRCMLPSLCCSERVWTVIPWTALHLSIVDCTNTCSIANTFFCWSGIWDLTTTPVNWTGAERRVAAQWTETPSSCSHGLQDWKNRIVVPHLVNGSWMCWSNSTWVSIHVVHAPPQCTVHGRWLLLLTNRTTMDDWQRPDPSYRVTQQIRLILWSFHNPTEAPRHTYLLKRPSMMMVMVMLILMFYTTYNYLIPDTRRYCCSGQ